MAPSISAQRLWTREQKLRFVQEYVKHKALLVSGCKNETKNRKVLRHTALLQLSKSMNMPGFGTKEAYGKLRNIKSTYAQELKKIRAAAARGNKYVSNLIWFNTLDKAFKALNKEKCTLCIEASNIDTNTSEDSGKIDVSNSLVIEANADYTVKHEVFEDEGDYDVDASNYLEEEEQISIERENQRTIKVPLYAGVKNYANSATDAAKVDNKSSPYDSCEGMSNEQLLVAHIKNEFDVFGESIGAQLKNMPLPDALEAQMYIQNYLSSLRLQALRRQSP